MWRRYLIGNVLADQHVYELSLARYWLVLCGAGGLLLFLIGARAVGLALLGAVLGMFAAFFMAPNLDLFPTSLPIGASVGLVIGGILGLLFRERLPSSVLRWMGIITAIGGVIAVVVIHRAATTICTFPLRYGHYSLRHCLPSWSLLAQGLFAFDGVVVVALFFGSSARAKEQPSPAEVGPVAT